MKKIIPTFFVLSILFACGDVSTTDKTLEPFGYSENFETNELSAWASYPLWQDTAFDPNMRVGKIVPGDSNLSIVQKVTPYTSVDNYAGAQKKLDMYLVPGSRIKLRYYLKTQLNPEFFRIRLASGPDGKVEYTISNPKANKWVWIEAGYNDLDKSHLWFRSKSFDTFCLIGPYLVPVEVISDPNNIDLILKINDEIKQQSNTSRMIFKIPRLINFASEIMTLKAGVIICTGTPEGISEIIDGDIVTCELSEIGLLSNTVKSV